MIRVRWVAMSLVGALMVGCESLDSSEDLNLPVRPESQNTAQTETSPASGGQTAQETTSPSPSPTPAPTAAGDVPADFAGVRWLHTNVSGWPQTASLNASVSPSTVTLNYNKSRVWPARNVNGTDVNANAWIFVFQDGVWYAATWEWLRPGQTQKSARSVNGDHIKKAPLNNFVPVSGERYGMMVSGLARDKTRNVQERSNVDMIVWP